MSDEFSDPLLTIEGCKILSLYYDEGTPHAVLDDGRILALGKHAIVYKRNQTLGIIERQMNLAIRTMRANKRVQRLTKGKSHAAKMMELADDDPLV